MDFGFMRASTSNFSKPNKKDDRVVLSYDGFSSYLLIVDEASRFVWVFLTGTKEPPLDIVDAFLSRFGHAQDPFALTRVVNLPDRWLFLTWSFGRITMS
jgi:hypothetical protein